MPSSSAGHIPKVFHRIWLGGPMPETYQRFGETWARHHPTWELRTWTADDLPPLRNQRQFEAAPTPAQKADIARYELVLEHGGVYLDCDFECLRPIDDLLDDLSFFGAEEAPGHLANSIFGSRPGSPILERVVEALPLAFEHLADGGIVEQTGPQLFDRIVRRSLARETGRTSIFPPEIFYPYGHWEQHLRGTPSPEAYAVHHWAGSWAEPPVEPPIPFGHRTKVRARKYLAGVKRRWDGLTPPPPAPLHGTYCGANRMLVRTTFGLPLRCIADDLSLTPALVLTGTYEPSFVRFLDRQIDLGDRVVDVGANVGLFTLRMAQRVGPTGQVFAYEPQPELHRLLRENVEMNYLGDRVTVIEAAAHRHHDGVKLFSTTRFRGNSSTTPKPAAYLQRATSDAVDEISVASEPLDDRLRAVPEVKLVKIDVEGGELDVLAGMTRLLSDGRVRMIALEFVAQLAGDRWDDLCDAVREIAALPGATASIIEPDGELSPIELDRAALLGDFSHLVLSIPRPTR